LLRGFLGASPVVVSAAKEAESARRVVDENPLLNIVDAVVIDSPVFDNKAPTTPTTTRVRDISRLGTNGRHEKRSENATAPNEWSAREEKKRKRHSHIKILIKLN